MDITKRVLLVDDDPDFLEPIRVLLERERYEVLVASSEIEGEKAMEAFKPDIAVFDLMMEHYDSGFILSYKLKKRYGNIPVIIATGVTSETGMKFAADSKYGANWTNADLIMDKGIRPDQILKEIKRFLKE